MSEIDWADWPVVEPPAEGPDVFPEWPSVALHPAWRFPGGLYAFTCRDGEGAIVWVPRAALGDDASDLPFRAAEHVREVKGWDPA